MVRTLQVVELEIQLDEIKEQYNNVIRNSNSKAQQKKMAFLERNLEQLTLVQKQLVDQNSALKKEAGIAERKLLARNERIQNLEALLQDADRRLAVQNQKFEAQLQAVKERLDQARGALTLGSRFDGRSPLTPWNVHSAESDHLIAVELRSDCKAASWRGRSGRERREHKSEPSTWRWWLRQSAGKAAERRSRVSAFFDV